MSDTPLVLSLFPGIGLLDRAFEEEGFCVVRGPDLLWGGDIRRFRVPRDRFNGIIGGPPCQAFSRLRHMVITNGHKVAANLIPEFERVVSEANPAWFLMENVEDAPLPNVPGYHVTAELVRDVWVGGVTNRLRRFSFGFCSYRTGAFSVETLALHDQQPELAAMAGNGRPVPVQMLKGGKRKANAHMNTEPRDALRDHIRKQGLPADFLCDAPFTASAKVKAIGNGVPLPMGRAVAKAVKKAMGYDFSNRES